MLEKRIINFNDGQERTGMQERYYVNIDKTSLSWIKRHILDRVVIGSEDEAEEVEEVVDELIEGLQSFADFHNDFVDENAEWV